MSSTERSQYPSYGIAFLQLSNISLSPKTWSEMLSRFSVRRAPSMFIHHQLAQISTLCLQEPLGREAVSGPLNSSTEFELCYKGIKQYRMELLKELNFLSLTGVEKPSYFRGVCNANTNCIATTQNILERMELIIISLLSLLHSSLFLPRVRSL